MPCKRNRPVGFWGLSIHTERWTVLWPQSKKTIGETSNVNSIKRNAWTLSLVCSCIPHAFSSVRGFVEHRSETLTLTFLGSSWTDDFFSDNWQTAEHTLPARLTQVKKLLRNKMLQSLRRFNSIYASLSGAYSYSNRCAQFNFVREFASKQNKIRLNLASF